MWQYQNTDELYHHGVIGMKWGVIRSKLFNKKRKRKNINQQEVSPEKKRNKIYYKDASNEQLRKAAERIELENRYKTAIENMHRLNPKKVSLGKKVVSKVFREVIVPSAISSGRKYLTSMLDSKIGESKQTQQFKKELSNELRKNVKQNSVKKQELSNDLREMLVSKNDLGKVYIDTKLLKNK